MNAKLKLLKYKKVIFQEILEMVGLDHSIKILELNMKVNGLMTNTMVLGRLLTLTRIHLKDNG